MRGIRRRVSFGAIVKEGPESTLRALLGFLETANHRQRWGAKLPAWHRNQVAGPPKGNSDHALFRVPIPPAVSRQRLEA